MMISHTLRSGRGFTLVELLVSIAIIATLAGLATTGTLSAMRAAKATKTLNNMKSIGTSLETIVGEGLDTGYHPPGTFIPYSGNLNDEDQTSFVWWDLIAETIGIAERRSGSFDWQEHPSKTDLQNPLSKQKLGGSGAFSSFNTSPRTRGSYAYNAKLGGNANSEDEELSEIVAMAHVDDLSNTIIFAESSDDETSAGHHFSSTRDAPQGNYKDSVHCYFSGGTVKLIKNKHLKDARSFKFYTTIEKKNFDDEP